MDATSTNDGKELVSIARDVVETTLHSIPEGYAIVVVVTDPVTSRVGVSGSHGMTYTLDMLRCAIELREPR